MAGRQVWKHYETLALIDVWEEKYFSLRNNRRTSVIHNEIKQALSARGVRKSLRQIVVKIDNMTQKYRKTRIEGKQNRSWIFFNRLDSFLDKQPSCPKTEVTNEDKKPEVIVITDVTNESTPQNQDPPLQKASIQGSHCDPDSSQELLNRNQVAGFRNYPNEVLDVLKQCLSVQKKAFDLLKDIQDASSKPGIPNDESH